MKRLILGTMVLALGAIFFSSFSGKDGGDNPKYQERWEKIDSLERKGLFRMALAEVDQIFDMATKDENHNQVIKSVLYELKYNSYLEEDDYVIGIYRLDELVKKAPSPSKEILHSLIAEVYWGYYSANTWKYSQRTNVVEVDLEDIRTWDLKRIAEKVRNHYLLSLRNDDISKSKNIRDYDEIASYTSESNQIRPTLYDFLAHRALDFFKSNTFNVPGPAETFVMEDDRYFESAHTFSGINALTNDSLNTRFFAVKIFQELTRFHKKENNIEALFLVDLERIKFVNQYCFISEKDAKYYKALERLTNAYSQTPYVSEAWYEIAVFHSNKGDTYSFKGDTTSRWEKKKAYDICASTVKKFPNAYGSQQCTALMNTITQKYLNLRGEQATIPNLKSKYLIEYKNVHKLYYKIIPYDYKKIRKGYDYDRLVKDLRTTKGTYSKTLDLTDPGDYQNHSTEILIPELENGFYYVVVSSDPAFAEGKTAFAYMPLWVSNITYQTRRGEGDYQVMISDRTTGLPLEGAKAEVTYEKYNYKLRKYEKKTIGTFTSDADGLFEFIPHQEYYTYDITITYQGDTYSPNQGIYAYNYYDYSPNTTVTHFFTDRKIYRPGQTIYFKGICVESEGKERNLRKGMTSTVYFYDVNGQEVAHQEVTTNEFGSFEGKFTAPYDVLTGQMSLTNSYGYSYFRVEEYKRPKFNVEMNPIEGEYQVNDKVEATGFAEAFAGNRLDGADVKYRVTRTTGYNWSWWYWGWWQPYASPKEIAQGDLVTDEKGEFKIQFDAIPDKSADKSRLPIFTYTVYVDVTDINGETHSSSRSLIVGYQSLQLGHNLRGDMNNAEDYFLRLSATNLNGQKIPAKGEIKFTKLKMPNRTYYSRYWQEPDMQQWTEKEFRELFPLEQFKDENVIYNWADEKEVFATNFDTKKTDSIAIKNYKSWDPGIYRYEATAKDKNGIEVKDVYYFTVFNPGATASPNNDVLWIKELQQTAEPGETIEILLGTQEENLSVYYDLEVNNDLVEGKRINLSKEQKKISFPVQYAYRGNFSIHFSAIKNNKKFGKTVHITVPYTDKELDLKFSTFRNKLLPGDNEEWTLTIKNSNGQGEAAELLATLYDASLDELYTPNSFYLNVYQYFYGNKYWSEGAGMQQSYASNINYYWNDYISYPYRYFPTLNYHGFNTYYYPGRYYWYDYDGYYGDDSGGEVYNAVTGSSDNNRNETRKNKDYKSADMDMLEVSEEEVMDEPNAAPMEQTIAGGSFGTGEGTGTTGKLEGQKQDKGVDLSTISARSNFNETAFFYPQLTADEKGNVKITFTIPESLTKWRFLGLAHTKDLKTGTIQEEVVTQKDLMVVPNAPRFLREGDKITISTKISNISEDSLNGKVELQLIDPFTDQPLDAKFEHKKKQLDFHVGSKRSTTASWTIKVPYEVSAVKYRIVAAAGDFSDGEENVLPILSNRMMVTESLPLPIRGKEKKDFEFTKLINSNQSSTLRHHRYTLEFTSNPAWYAVQAMPYMMEYPYECSEQTFTRYYSNAIASHIMNSNPKIRKVIEDWGENSPEAFLSNLQKNQELKSLILEETPWVLDAKNEEQSKRNLAVLLDMERMTKELDKALGKIIKSQSVNGGWPWFPGMPESRYITQHIITGMGHLDHLGIKDVKENHKTWRMIEKGVNYLDGEIYRDYKYAQKWDPDYLTNMHIGYTQIQYLYARSYFPQINMDKKTKEAVQYYKDQATKFWLQFNIYAEGMIALAAHRLEMTDLASDVVKSLKDRSIHHEEFGMYWKDFHMGYYWYEAPIETQALMIEMFDEVANDQESVEELKIWLLKQKQTTNWKTTKQTTEAVYALLLKGTDLLASDDLVEITIGGKKIEYKEKPEEGNSYQVKAQAGTGYFKTAWTGDKVKPEMGRISVKKASTGVAWGAVYWQYFEDLDKITFAETNLKLNKQLFLVNVTNQGEQLKPINDKNVVHVGDKLRVRIELRTDRNLEYVHMKDMRASGFEPIDVLSTYHWQDGLGYYQATKDAATNFFFDYIPKGTYVFEYDLRVQHEGDFSNGITTIQCMYAPEFTSHSEGIRVTVE